MAHDHRLRRLAFDGFRRRAEFGLDHQPVTVLGQRVADVGELGLLAFALAIEPVPIPGEAARRSGMMPPTDSEMISPTVPR
jgi:hypothetical protein